MVNRTRAIGVLFVALLISADAITVTNVINTFLEHEPNDTKQQVVHEGFKVGTRLLKEARGWLMDRIEASENVQESSAGRGALKENQFHSTMTAHRAKIKLPAQVLAASAILLEKAMEVAFADSPFANQTAKDKPTTTTDDVLKSAQSMLQVETTITATTTTTTTTQGLVHVVEERRGDRQKIASDLAMTSLVFSLLGGAMLDARVEETQESLVPSTAPLGDRIRHFFGVYGQKLGVRFFAGLTFSFGSALICFWLGVFILARLVQVFEKYYTFLPATTEATLTTAFPGPLVVCKLSEGGGAATSGVISGLSVPSTAAVSQWPDHCFQLIPLDSAAADPALFTTSDAKPASNHVFRWELPESFSIAAAGEVDMLAIYMFSRVAALETDHLFATVWTPLEDTSGTATAAAPTTYGTDPTNRLTLGWRASFDSEDNRLKKECDPSVPESFSAGCGGGDVAATESAALPFGVLTTNANTAAVLMPSYFIPTSSSSDHETWCKSQLPIRVRCVAFDAVVARDYFIFRPGCGQYFGPREMAAITTAFPGPGKSSP